MGVTIKEFKKQLKDIGDVNDLPMLIQDVVNRREYSALLETILMGALLVMNDELDITGYKTYADVGSVPTQIVDAVTGKVLIDDK